MPGGWHHAAQGVRIVEVLEHLNLTWEVRDGVRSHSWKIAPPRPTREGECVRYADRIGYLPRRARRDPGRRAPARRPPAGPAVFGEPGSEMVGAMISAVVEGSLARTTGRRRRHGPRRPRGDARTPGVHVRAGLRVRHRGRAEARRHRGHPAAGRPPPGPPRLIPVTYRDTEADAVTQVVDYVSGMTDRFALNMHDRLFDADATSQMTPLLRRLRRTPRRLSPYPVVSRSGGATTRPLGARGGRTSARPHPPGAAAAVALELAGDLVAVGLGEVDLGGPLLQRAHVLDHLGVLGGHLVDGLDPVVGPGERRAGRAAPAPPRRAGAAPRSPGATAAARRSAGRRPRS